MHDPITSKQTDVRTVALVGKVQPDTSDEPIRQVIQTLLGLGKAVLIEEKTHAHFALKQYPSVALKDLGQTADLVIAIGGDGTMLGVARQMAPYNIPLIGINQGHLGFITDIALPDAPALLRDMLLEHIYQPETRSLLHAQIIRQQRLIHEGMALNDVVVSRNVLEGMLELNVHVDDNFMYSQRADGLIIATPTGSTAYSLAANGPILHPQLAGITLAPVAPQSLSNRPIVLPNHCKIRIQVVSPKGAVIHWDSHHAIELQQNDVITIELSPHQCIFWHPIPYNYFSTLRQKLHWQLNPAQPSSVLL